MKQVITTERVPIKIWTEEIEEGALNQAKNLANLPFIFKHVALMPDCLSKNTEVLTQRGFVLINELKNTDLVCNYNPNNLKTFFEKPIAIINRAVKNEEVIYEFVSTMMNKSIIVNETHRMPLKTNLGILAKDISDVSEINSFNWAGIGNEKKDYDISDELLCLIAWIIGDGNIKLTNKKIDGTFSSINIRFGLKKERKIKQIKLLLDSLKIIYSINKNKRGDTIISINVENSRKLLKLVGIKKEYPIHFITDLSTRQAMLFLEECIKVDGEWNNYLKYNTIVYSSTRKKDINFLSSLIAIHSGIAKTTTIYSDNYKKGNFYKLKLIPHNSLEESNNGFSKSKIIKREIKYTGNLVCITCSTGFFIARQNGMTFVTGNCHQGYGMPIGGVVALKGVVGPNLVGVDIGCGMISLKTSLTEISKEDLVLIRNKIIKYIPVGKNHQKTNQDRNLLPLLDDLPKDGIVLKENKENRLLKQLGTLGGGNHFIEIQKGDDGHIWIMIHSGSRNLGHRIATHYNKIAKELNEKYYSIVDSKLQLAFLPIDTQEGKDYMIEMNYAVKFALANRKLMMERVKKAFTKVIKNITFNNFINIPHNYATIENHFGKNVIIHRKGATSARKGEFGIIPGSQGTKSYIVEGFGNKESFTSCSHGAGRNMSRTKAQNELNLESEIKNLDKQGIIHGISHRNHLDEAPGAYKDINTVMKNQEDLVSVVVELTPLAVVKANKILPISNNKFHW